MKYNRINDLVPEGEHFDESAVGEGVWISSAHLRNIECALENASTAQEAVQSRLDESGQTVSDLTEQLDTATQTIADRDATIASLQQQLAEIGGKASGSGSHVAAPAAVETAASGSEDKSGVYSLDDPNHPANRTADRYMKRYQR